MVNHARWVVLATVFVGCAGVLSGSPSSQQKAKKAEPKETAEDLAIKAERLINEAERNLESLEADTAVNNLDEASSLLIGSTIRGYPDYDLLVERRDELRELVPKVREEIHRRELLAAVKAARMKINEDAKVLRVSLGQLKRDPPPEAFESAENTASSISTTLSDNTGLEMEDKVYRKYAKGVRNKLKKWQSYIKKRRLAEAVKQKGGEIKAARSTLGKLLKQIKRGSVTEEELTEAETAAGELKKAIDGAEDLRSKDQRFGKTVTKAEKQQRDATKKIEKRRHQVAVSRQTQKVKAANKALARALKKIASPADAEEATEVAAELDKVLGEGDETAVKDQRYRKLADSARAKLTAARKTIEKKKLAMKVAAEKQKIGAALAEVRSTIAELLIGSPEDSEYEVVLKRTDEVEKLLEESASLASKSSNLSDFIRAARKTLHKSRGQIRARRVEVEVETQKRKVRAALSTMNDTIESITDEDESVMKEVRDAIDTVDRALSDGVKLEEQSPNYRKFAKKVKKAVSEAYSRAKGRQAKAGAGQRRQLLVGAMKDLMSAFARLKSKKAAQEDVEEARAALSAVKKHLAAGEPVEEQDKGYRKFAAKMRKRARSIEQKGSVILFERGPIAALADGLDLTKGAAFEEDPEQKMSAFQDALKRFTGCMDQAVELLSTNANLRKRKFSVGRKKLPAQSVVVRCREEAKAAEERLGAFSTRMAFHEKTGKAFLEGLDLLGTAESTQAEESKKAYTAALKQFESCVASGQDLANQHPELKAEKFLLEGKEIGLEEVISACTKRIRSVRKALSGS